MSARSSQSSNPGPVRGSRQSQNRPSNPSPNQNQNVNAQDLFGNIFKDNTQALSIFVIVFAMAIVYNTSSLVLTAIILLLVSTTLIPAPDEQSFQLYFKEWFIADYVPRFSKHYRDYLKKKASRASIVKAASLTIERWFNKATEDVNAMVLYETSAKRCLPNAIRYSLDVCSMLNRIGIYDNDYMGNTNFRIIIVDLGSREQPMHFVFVGIFQRWIKLPICLNAQFLPTLDPLNAFDGGILSFEDVKG